MFRTLALLGLVASASAFTAPARSGAVRAGRSTLKMAQRSQAVPFLKQPKKLDGSMAGDIGFDPLGLSEVFDLKFMREAEIKHGRVAMLACLGVFTQMVVQLPGEMHAQTNPVDAFYSVGAEPLAQIFVAIGFLESNLHKGKISYNDMECNGGDFGFDPAGLSRSKKFEEYKEKEIANGRLAMIAIGGLLHSCFATGQPIWLGN